MVIGRNDICNCGSGLKYKKCCMNTSVKFDKWYKNAVILYGNESKIIDVYFDILKVIDKKNWQGSCHASASIFFIFANELNLNPILYVGEVLNKKLHATFSHSWVEINNSIYDMAIYRQLNSIGDSIPIFNGFKLHNPNLKNDNYSYGISKDEEILDNDCKLIINMNITEYLDNFPLTDFGENGLWTVIESISKNINFGINIENIKDKYKLINRELKTC